MRCIAGRLLLLLLLLLVVEVIMTLAATQIITICGD